MTLSEKKTRATELTEGFRFLGGLVRLQEINPILRGWTGHFRHCVGTRRILSALDRYVRQRLWLWLRSKHKRVLTRRPPRLGVGPDGLIPATGSGTRAVLSNTSWPAFGACGSSSTGRNPLTSRKPLENRMHNERCTSDPTLLIAECLRHCGSGSGAQDAPHLSSPAESGTIERRFAFTHRPIPDTWRNTQGTGRFPNLNPQHTMR